MVSSLLSPIGKHKSTHVKPSKGKRAAKRETSEDSFPPPAAPDLASSVDVGFNVITTNLSAGDDSSDGTGIETRKYSMVFVSRGDQSPAFNCHFPKMVCAASQKLRPEDRTRLVGFSKPCSERLSQCLGVARVSSLAIAHGAPGSDALWEMVKTLVEPIDGKWLEAGSDGNFVSTKINAVETTIGPKKPKKS